MKKIFFFAAAAAMMAACSENDQLALNQQVQDQQDKGIQFGVYTNRAVTRAGQAESLNTDALKNGDGIGVFAYHTNNSKYDERTSLPNFMYNQNVKWDATIGNGVWTYAPVKYWPNEFGENAVSEDVDYVTFFAYAPYVSVNPTTGIPEVDMKAFDAEKFAQYLGYVATDDKTAVEDFRTKEGYKAKEEGETADDAVEALKMLYIKQQQGKNITSISRNADKGDPIVRYVVDTNPQTSVDLLWGVAAENNGFVGLADKAATISTDNCYLNLSKQIGTTDSIKWKFYHALAKLNVQIIAAADVVTEGVDPYNPDADTKALQEATKIYLRSIDFTGFATRGALNLHSEDAVPGYVKPNWMNYDGTDLTAGTVTFYDGLKDGKEGYTDNIATGEKPLGLNPELIEEPTTTTWAAKRQGIPTQKYANLFAGAIDDPATTDKDEAATASIFVIPTNERMAITVIYDIMTSDPLLSQNLSDGFTKGSRVQNKISQTLEGLKLEAGKSYTIKLVVGIESVKVTVDVENFIETDAQKVDLPYNPYSEGTQAIVNGQTYANISDAILAAAEESTDDNPQTIKLAEDCNSAGIILPTGSNIIIDFNGKTLTIDSDPLAGSNGTKNQCFQLLKGSKVVMKNGTIKPTNPNLKMIIQNYSDLTLDNMVLDASAAPQILYALSTNQGNSVIKDTKITASTGNVAFDVCCGWGGYTNNQVEVTGNSEINGPIELSMGSQPATASLILTSGKHNGNIKVEDGGDQVTVTKASAFDITNQTLPAGYMWDADGKLVTE